MANAGHLALFLNGDEISLPSALPLGLLADAVFEKTGVQVEIGERLTLYTDGLLEARNATERSSDLRALPSWWLPRGTRRRQPRPQFGLDRMMTLPY